jgi:hypothetical protein
MSNVPDVEIRYSRNHGLIEALMVLGVVGVLGIGFAVGGRDHFSDVSAVLTMVALIATIWLGGRALRRAFDKRPVVRLNAEGIADSRVRSNPVPWAKIEAASQSRDCDGYEKVYLWPRIGGFDPSIDPKQAANDDAEPICIDLGDLDSTAEEVTERIRGFAPEVAIRSQYA